MADNIERMPGEKDHHFALFIRYIKMAQGEDVSVTDAYTQLKPKKTNGKKMSFEAFRQLFRDKQWESRLAQIISDQFQTEVATANTYDLDLRKEASVVKDALLRRVEAWKTHGHKYSLERALKKATVRSQVLDEEAYIRLGERYVAVMQALQKITNGDSESSFSQMTQNNIVALVNKIKDVSGDDEDDIPTVDYDIPAKKVEVTDV